jgi:predicted amidohydrolase
VEAGAACARRGQRLLSLPPSIAWAPKPPWNIGEFYGSSYFCQSAGTDFAQASRDKDEVLTADLNLDEIAEVRRTWQFYRDRRPDLYGPLVAS